MALLFALSEGLLDPLPLGRVDAFRAELREWLAGHAPDVLALSDGARPLAADARGRLRAALQGLAASVTAQDQPRPEGTT